MGAIGVPELLILSFVLGPVLVWGVFFWGLRGRAKRLGYATTRAYLRAAPGSDMEKRDAVDLALKGVVFCVLGLLFGPFVLAGLVPLFYGARKLVYASLGLGLVDDADQPHA